MEPTEFKRAVLIVLVVVAGCTKYDGPTSPGPNANAPSIVQLAPASAPLPAHPTNGSKFIPVPAEFRWSAIATATSYQVQISRSAEFGEIDVDLPSIPKVTVSVGTLQSFKFYFWRVRAINAQGFGPWSPPSSFKTSPDAGNGPSL